MSTQTPTVDDLIVALAQAGATSGQVSVVLANRGMKLAERTVRDRAQRLGVAFSQHGRVPDTVVLQLVAMLIQKLGHGWGYTKLAFMLRQNYGVSRRQTRAAMQALAPRSFAARAAEPFQRLLRGNLVLPHSNLWWQLDLDCKLQDFGIYVAAVVDAHDRTILCIVVLPDKTALRIWHSCVAVALQRVGCYPEMMTTDAAQELKLVGFACIHARHT